LDTEFRQRFEALWGKHFDGEDLPITFCYTDQEGRAELVEPGSSPRCLIAALAEVRSGRPLCFGPDSIGCAGGRRYVGFAEHIRPDFEYFLSCGIPGRLEGERYMKSPELVREVMEHAPRLKAPRRYIVFKRWDDLQESDDVDVVIFFARPDVLSGLFTLANYDEPRPEGVFTPFGAGCSSIVQYPYIESGAAHPRGVIGMFDVSARPHVPENVLTFAVPFSKLVSMADNMEESFLITRSWERVRQRLQ
jgi:uncharacterized protein (DUF169 family)